MSTKGSDLIPINIVAGVQPSTDKTAASTVHYTHSDKIRFRLGLPEKIGGWGAIEFDDNETIEGAVRSLYSDVKQLFSNSRTLKLRITIDNSGFILFSADDLRILFYLSDDILYQVRWRFWSNYMYFLLVCMLSLIIVFVFGY